MEKISPFADGVDVAALKTATIDGEFIAFDGESSSGVKTAGFKFAGIPLILS